MKILLAENDLTTRDLMKRILLRVSDTVLEARDGLEALEIVEREDPDFLFTDVDLSLIDGFELIRSVRSSARWAKLPVVCFSALRDRDEVMRLLDMGVVDYMLKPIRAQSAHDRVKTVITQYSGWRGKPRSAATRRTLLLVDPDPNFRAFARLQLDAEFIVIESSSGADAARRFQRASSKPDIVLIASRLPLLSEVQLASLLRTFAGDAGAKPPFLVLATDDPGADRSAAFFDGSFRRTFVPGDFQAEVRRLFSHQETPHEKLHWHLNDPRHEWLATGVRQTLGVMAGSEASILQSPPQDGITEGVRGRIWLTSDELAGGVVVEIATSTQVARHLAAAVLRTDELTLSQPTEVLGELVNVIGGRIRAALEEYGWFLRLGLPDVDSDVRVDHEPWTRSAWFATSSDDTFHVGMRLVTHDRCDHMAHAGPTFDASGAELQTASIGDAIDDVLF